MTRHLATLSGHSQADGFPFSFAFPPPPAQLRLVGSILCCTLFASRGPARTLSRRASVCLFFGPHTTHCPHLPELYEGLVRVSQPRSPLCLSTGSPPHTLFQVLVKGFPVPGCVAAGQSFCPQQQRILLASQLAGIGYLRTPYYRLPFFVSKKWYLRVIVPLYQQLPTTFLSFVGTSACTCAHTESLHPQLRG
jgi:hypothetical protein